LPWSESVCDLKHHRQRPAIQAASCVGQEPSTEPDAPRIDKLIDSSRPRIFSVALEWLKALPASHAQLLVAFAFVFVPGLAVALVAEVHPDWREPIREVLGLSWVSPWGILTAVFVHDDLDHFLWNMVALFAGFLFFGLTNMRSGDERVNREWLLVITIVISAVIAHLLFLLFRSQFGIGAGASGLVTATVGVAWGLALADWRTLPPKGPDRLVIVASVSCLGLLYVSMGVVHLVHTSALLVGFALELTFLHLDGRYL